MNPEDTTINETPQFRTFKAPTEINIIDEDENLDADQVELIKKMSAKYVTQLLELISFKYRQ